MLIREKLNNTSVRDLRELLRRLRMGSIGFDCNRHPECKSKDGLINFILREGNSNGTPPATDTLNALLCVIAVEHAEPEHGDDPEQPALPMPRASEHAPPAQQTPTSKEPAPMPAPDTAAAAAQLATLIAQLTSRAGVDETEVRAIVAAELDKRPAPVIIIRRPDAPDTKREGYRHPIHEKALRIVASGLNVMLSGPAGSGKTTLAEQIAHDLGLHFAAISYTAGASESQLLGRFLPTGENGTFEYTDTPVMRAYEGIDGKGGLFLHDEFDAADANFAPVLNAATSNGHFYNDFRHHAPRVNKHPDSRQMATVNTYGTGADLIYSGRNALDAATLDRWYVLRMEFDANLDRSMAGMSPESTAPWKPAPDPTPADLAELCTWTLAVRKQIAASKLHRVFSPRATHKAITARRAGVPSDEIKRDLLAGWTADELAKLGGIAPRMAA